MIILYEKTSQFFFFFQVGNMNVKQKKYFRVDDKDLWTETEKKKVKLLMMRYYTENKTK